MKIFLIMSLLLSSSAWAAKTLRCEYNNKLNQVEFSLNNFDLTSFKKEFKVKDKKYSIVVKNVNVPSEIDDFLTISDDKYKMTYALDCQLHDPQLATNNYYPQSIK